VAGTTPGVARAPAWRRPHARTALGLGALFVVIYALAMGKVVVRADEAWYLWAVTRVTRGETLYRDVNFVTTPLSAWLSSLAVRIAGSQILVIRFLNTAVFLAATVLAWSVARRCGLGRVGRTLLVIALIGYASPIAQYASLYSTLALVLALGALVVLLRWLAAIDAEAGATPNPRRVSRELLGAGALIGLAFDSKPTVGALAAAAIALTIVEARWNRNWRTRLAEVGQVAGAAALAVGAMLAIVAATGDFGAFWGDVFAEKSYYFSALSAGGPMPGLFQLGRVLPWVAPSQAYATDLELTLVVLPFLAVLVLGWAVVRARGRTRVQAAAVAQFAVVALLGMIPRAGNQHLAEAAPLLMATAAGGLGLVAPWPAARRVLPFTTRFLAVWLTILLVAVVVRAIEPFTESSNTFFTAPHFNGTPIEKFRLRRLAQDRATFRRFHATTVFIVRVDAAFFYLTEGLRDPTPYDFADISDFGPDDQPGVIRLLRSGRVRWVCLLRKPRKGQPLPTSRPLAVEHYVRKHFRLRTRVHACTLFEAPGSPAPHGR
jgi:4-amino-4-deoxy-L-arabinose transferase-like glycosyltransferase